MLERSLLWATWSSFNSVLLATVIKVSNSFRNIPANKNFSQISSEKNIVLCLHSN